MVYLSSQRSVQKGAAMVPALRKANAGLRRLMRDTGATSCALFVHDPFWGDELRSVLKPGVRCPEPLHGFLPSSHAPAVANAPNKTTILIDIIDHARHEQVTPIIARIPDEIRHLYGGFARREGLRSSLRAAFQYAGRNQAILFLNFIEPLKKQQPLPKARLRRAMRELIDLISDIKTEMVLETTRRVPVLTLVLKALEEMTRLVNRHDHLQYAQAILDAGFKAFSLDDATGIGTFHAFDTGSRSLLRLAASRGRLAPSVPDMDFTNRVGIIAWVAQRRQALLIDDLQKSPFRALYRHSRAEQDVRSELAIPVVAGEEMLGVVNFESTSAHAFPEDSVRAVGYLAHLTAVATTIAKESVRAERLDQDKARLLELSGTAAQGRDGARKALKQLAQFAVGTLQASECDIWHYDNRRSVFSTGGATYDSFDDSVAPRPNGWTEYLCREKHAVWIWRTADVSQFTAYAWSGETTSWGTVAESSPRSVNSRGPEGIAAELGLPIRLREQVVGVIWLKYRTRSTGLPSAKEMEEAAGIAGQASLVLGSEERNTDLDQRRAYVRTTRTFRTNLLPDGQRIKDPLDVFVISRPHSDIGGDFHAAEQINGDTVAFVVGDCESHGDAAAVGMIPLLTTFRHFFRESQSTKFMMERLLAVADDMGIHATAISFVITRLEHRFWLFASSAGHPALLVARPGKGDTYNLDPFPDGSLRTRMLGVTPNVPAVEDRRELQPGDIVIAYTDGITEAARNSDRERDEFSEGRIQQALLALSVERTVSAATVALRIEDDAKRFSGGAFTDDATILVVRIPRP